MKSSSARRRAAHTLSPAEEKLLSEAGPLAAAPSGIYSILTNADFPYPTVRLSDSREVRVNQAAFANHRASPNRADRQAVMQAFFGALGGFSRTFGTTISGQAMCVDADMQTTM